MSTRLIAGGLIAVFAVAGFLAGRQGGAEPARSQAAVPAPLDGERKPPRLSALGSSPAPPALARERKTKSKPSSAPDAGTGAIAPSSAGTAPATPPVTAKGPATTTAPSTPTQTSPSTPPASSSPPDLGTRDE